jgi:hypothetical protein
VAPDALEALTPAETREVFDSLHIGPPLHGLYDGRVLHMGLLRPLLARLWRGKMVTEEDVVNRTAFGLRVRGVVSRTDTDTLIRYPIGLTDAIRFAGQCYLGRLVLPADQSIWFTLTANEDA